jgi:hypothetical protein
MGLLRASLIFVIGNFTIRLLQSKHIDKVHTVPIIGPMFGQTIKKIILDNKTMALLIFITLVEFIL